MGTGLEHAACELLKSVGGSKGAHIGSMALFNALEVYSLFIFYFQISDYCDFSSHFTESIALLPLLVRPEMQ